MHVPPLPIAPTKPQTPRAPAVAPGRPAPQNAAGRWEDEPSGSGGWDAADTATNFPDPSQLPEAAPRGLGPVAPVASPSPPAAPANVRAVLPTAPGVGAPLGPAPAPVAVRANATPAAAEGLGTAMREEVWAIVRAAVEEAMGPLVARQRDLEARIERAERERDAERTRAARAPQPAPSPLAQGGGSAAAMLASLGQGGGAAASGPAPPVVPVAPPAARAPADRAAFTPVGEPGPAPPEPRLAAPESAPSPVAHPPGPRPAGATGYGVGLVAAPRAHLDLDAVGPVDVQGFDGRRRQRRVTAVVASILILIIVGAVTMSILSHS